MNFNATNLCLSQGFIHQSSCPTTSSGYWTREEFLEIIILIVDLLNCSPNLVSFIKWLLVFLVARNLPVFGAGNQRRESAADIPAATGGGSLEEQPLLWLLVFLAARNFPVFGAENQRRESAADIPAATGGGSLEEGGLEGVLVFLAARNLPVFGAGNQRRESAADIPAATGGGSLEEGGLEGVVVDPSP
uniref:Uncharacterized protein n=1 Tax=Parastrongyloides trichosuri TaxID=131310 RepID=A0A0N4ZIX4_PARTI